MRIDKKLNLVVPVELGADEVAYVHAEPLSLAVFEANAVLLGKTFAAMFQEGLGAIAGPRVAAALMRQVAEMSGAPAIMQQRDALMNEMRRLANVVAITDSRWATFPLQEAIDRKFFSERDLSEVENALVYFIVASSMYRRADLTAALDGAGQLWGAQTTSSTCTEYAASLPMSTEAAISPPATMSSVPV